MKCLLKAFQDITVIWHITPLSESQQHILVLLGLPIFIYKALMLPVWSIPYWRLKIEQKMNNILAWYTISGLSIINPFSFGCFFHFWGYIPGVFATALPVP